MKCRHCGEGVYLYEWRWRHVNGMYVCTLPGRPKPRAEPEEETNERTD